MPKNRIKRGRRERVLPAPTIRNAKRRVRCPACGAEQRETTACRVCHAALVRDAVILADGSTMDVDALLALPTREDALARLVSSGFDEAAAEVVLDQLEADKLAKLEADAEERDAQRRESEAKHKAITDRLAALSAARREGHEPTDPSGQGAE